MDEQINEAQPYRIKKELRQQKRMEESRFQKQKQTTKLIKGIAYIGIGVGILVSGIYFISKSTDPKGEDFSRAIELMETSHVPEDSILPEYTSNPPTSGPHYGQTARSGFRDKELPDQNIIHNLEHGDIWIAFHPRISDDLKNELKKFGVAKVIITPRETNETDIAVAAWGRLDTFNIENNVIPEQRIEEFIRRYSNKGPEQVPGMSGGI